MWSTKIEFSQNNFVETEVMRYNEITMNRWFFNGFNFYTLVPRGEESINTICSPKKPKKANFLNTFWLISLDSDHSLKNRDRIIKKCRSCANDRSYRHREKKSHRVIVTIWSQQKHVYFISNNTQEAITSSFLANHWLLGVIHKPRGQLRGEGG